MKLRSVVTVGLGCILTLQMLWLLLYAREASRNEGSDHVGFRGQLGVLEIVRQLQSFRIPPYLVVPRNSPHREEENAKLPLLQIRKKEGPHQSQSRESELPTVQAETQRPIVQAEPRRRLADQGNSKKPIAPDAEGTHLTRRPGGASKPKRKARSDLVFVEGDVLANVSLTGGAADTARGAATMCPTTLRHLANAAVVILTYNRPDMLEQTIAACSAARLSSSIAKYISQDGADERTRVVAQTSGSRFTYLQHPRTLDDHLGPDNSETPSTMFVADHYKWVLDVMFVDKGHSHVIILEDDLKVSGDFFEYFEMLAPMLDVDPSLWCISSWNDNGFKYYETPRNALFRSSYFPGLGWMLKRELWINELSGKFPADNWDHWMRASTTSKNRECISPFLSRNYNIGVGGATSSQEFYQQYLEPIAFEPLGAPMGFGDLSYLLNERYFADMKQRISGGAGIDMRRRRVMPASDVRSLDVEQFPRNTVSVVTFVKEEFEALAMTLQIHPSPRSSYRRTIWLKYNGAEIFLVDRRLSPFVPESHRIRVNQALRAVPAAEAGMSCDAVCRAVLADADGYMWRCHADQFEFINDCQVLQQHFECPSGCTQGWGEDIPNVEVAGVGHTPRCLATEMTPTCTASFPFTKRLCPCVPTKQRVDAVMPVVSNKADSTDSDHVSARDEERRAARPVLAAKKMSDDDSPSLVVVPSGQTGKSCSEVCEEYSPSTAAAGDAAFDCYADAFAVVNECDVLRKHFACKTCEVNWGPDIPNYVADVSDGNFGRCLVTKDLGATTCEGRHAHTKRLCPCHRKNVV
jgi:alpha-1,3-mannosyl-glycoprotein beta-1,2-N-acetylglucosaminyltransferase